MNTEQMDCREDTFSILKGLIYLHTLGFLSAESELRYKIKT